MWEGATIRRIFAKPVDVLDRMRVDRLIHLRKDGDGLFEIFLEAGRF